jgi:hypothetical protein
MFEKGEEVEVRLNGTTKWIDAVYQLNINNCYMVNVAGVSRVVSDENIRKLVVN